MEEKAEVDAARKMWCFWLCVAVILLVFVVTIESTTKNGVTMNYTIYNKLTDGKPSSGEIRLEGR